MTHDISTMYGMIDTGIDVASDDLAMTIRCVFIVDPENKLVLSLNYPACVGRNMSEILRSLRSLQLSYKKDIATPANWPNNHSEVVLKDGTRTCALKGSVFLLPDVSHEQAKEISPNGYHTCQVPSNLDYLRLVKPEHVDGRMVHVPDSKEAQCQKQREDREAEEAAAAAALSNKKKKNMVLSLFSGKDWTWLRVLSSH